MQKAEYRNRKKSMETGWTEEERSTGGTADRGEREEGKRKNGRLSSQNRTEADERKLKQRGSESGQEAMMSRGMDGLEKVGNESRRQG